MSLIRRTLVGLACLLFAAPLLATDYYADVSGGPWTSSSTWHLISNSGPAAPAGTYPGSAPGDRAIIDFQGITVTLSASVPNAVTLETSNVACFVIVSAGGSLPLTGASFVGGGTTLQFTGGMITNAGTLEIRANSTFTWTGGTLTGGGSTTIVADPSVPGQLNISGGMLDTQTLNINGKALYTGSWSVDNGAQVNIASGGSFEIQSLGPVTTNTPGTADINNSGTFKKTAGAGGTNFSVPVNNNNLVQVTAGGLVLGGSPLHTNGTFDVANGSFIEFHGTFAGTNNVTGLGTASIVGTPMIDDGATVNFTNVDMSGGWIQGPAAGTGTANISGTVTFNGGVWIRNLSVNLQGTATTNITGAAGAFIDNAAVTNDGTFNVNAGAGSLGINNGGSIQNNATINLIGDLTLTSDGVNNARIDNKTGASILKTSGAGVASFNVSLNNTALVQSNSGGMKFNRSGTHTNGTFKICDSCIFEYAAGTHTLDNTSIQYVTFGDAATAKLAGATFDVTTSGSISTNHQFVHTSGTIQGAGSFSIFASYLWGGGTHSGTGDTSLGSFTHTFDGATGAMVIDGRSMSASGTLAYSPAGTNYLSLINGATFTNSGQMSLTSDAPIIGDGTATLDNRGATLQKTGGTGKATINAAVNSFNLIVVDNSKRITPNGLFLGGATINVSSGQLGLQQGGFTSANLVVPNATNAIVFEGGTFELRSGTTFSPTDLGQLQVSGGTLDFDATLTVQKLALTSGTITGTDFGVAQLFTWTGGTLLGPGNTSIDVGATMSHLAPTLPTFLDNRTLDIDGGADYEGTGLTLQNGAVLNNNAGADFRVRDGALLNGAGVNALNNAGSLRKTAGTSGMRIDVPLTNTGTVSSEVSGQSLIIAGGGTTAAGATLTTTAGALLDFFGGTFTVNGGSIGGTGQTRVVGGTLKIAVTMTAPVTLVVNSGALDVNAGITFSVDTLQWNGGTIQGAGTTRVAGGFIGNTAPTSLSNSNLTVAGGATFSYNADNTNFLTLTGSALLSVESGASFPMTANGTIAGNAISLPMSLQNFGTMRKTGGTGVSAIGVPVASSGAGASIGATSGTLRLSGGATTIASDIHTGASSTVEFSAGTYPVDAGASASGTGTVHLSGATVNFNAPSITLPNLNLSGGTLGGTGNVLVNGGTWSGGDMTGTGTFGISSGTFSITQATAKLLGRAMTNAATLSFDAPSPALAFGNVTLTNNSLLDFTAVPSITGTGLIHNTAGGTTKFRAATTLPVALNNDGIVETGANAALNGGGSHGGSFTFNNPAAVSITFGGALHTFSAASSISGNGSATFNATMSNVAASISLTGANSVLTTNANVSFTSATPVSTRALFVFSGTLGGTAAVTITSGGSVQSMWNGGTIKGSGAFTISSGVPIQFSNSLILDGRTITNNGTILFTLNGPDTLSLINGAAIDNNGDFSVSSIGSISGGTFLNDGTFLKVGAGGTNAISSTFTNTNIVNLTSGTVAFNGGFTQSSGSTTLAGGNMSSTLVDLNGGTLGGNGTINGNVDNGATINPGASAGTLIITGNYTQSGTLNIEIGGTAPGTGYDRLQVSGNASLGGTLNVTLIGGYVPAGGETYDPVIYSSNGGTTFATENLPSFGSGGFFDPDYLATSYRLTAVTAQADLVATQTTSGPAQQNQNATFTITVQNLGPSTAAGVTLSDTLTGATVVSMTSTVGTCTTSPLACNIGTLVSGGNAVITLVVNANTVGTINNSAAVSASPSTPDPNPGNNSTGTASIVVSPVADVQLTKTGPPTATTNGTLVYTISVKNLGPGTANGVVVTDTLPAAIVFQSNSGACATPFPCALGNIASGDTKTITSTYLVQPSAAGSTIVNSASASSQTPDPNSGNNSASVATSIDCPNAPPANLSPAGTGATSGMLTWNDSGADFYDVFFGAPGSGCATFLGTTATTSFVYSNLTPDTTYEWRVVGRTAASCPRSSSCITFTTETECTVPGAPLARVVGQTLTGIAYNVEIEPVDGATHYTVEEATNSNFTGATIKTVSPEQLLATFEHDVVAPTPFFYRVRAHNACTPGGGTYSLVMRVVIVPIAPASGNPHAVVPAGTTELVLQRVLIPGEPGQTLFFTATTDQPWLTVRPPSGVLPPEGAVVEAIADPTALPNGTWTATVIVSINTSASRVSTNATTSVSVPVSVSIVTPITPVPAKGTTSPHASIIPAVGHLGGINSHWQSDVRVTNTGFRSTRYRLTFTPSAGAATGVKQTDIRVDAGQTTALDDIVRTWYGLGALADGTSGMLEIVPLDDAANNARATVVTSRTYNVNDKGTLGQFIPAIPFANFIGRTAAGAFPQLLSLQQIAQNNIYRTNVGIAEGSGLNASAILSVFSSAGQKLTDIPVNLLGGQQIQLNALLAQHNITLDDGRIEVKVADGGGKVTAYASVIDGGTNDPLLVDPVSLQQTGANKYVLPGAANINTGFANWQTDMRVFNFGSASQPATLTFYPLNNGTPKVAQVLANPGQVLALNNVVKSLFGSENVGGAVHISTPQLSSLVVTGRTYNVTSEGTLGQFISAVTLDQAIGAGGGSLCIPQVEDSVRYRTNVGVAEVTGQETVIEVQVKPPDGKITPVVTITLAPNEFRQFAPVRELQLGNVYNALVTVRVVRGGRVTAYGSVIDEDTGDPTFVPPQRTR